MGCGSPISIGGNAISSISNTKPIFPLGLCRRLSSFAHVPSNRHRDNGFSVAVPNVDIDVECRLAYFLQFLDQFGAGRSVLACASRRPLAILT